MVEVISVSDNLYTTALTVEQAAQLQSLLVAQDFQLEPRPYTLCFAKKGKLTVAIYEKGPKAVIQGRGTADFVTFHLEPEILGEARLGYEEVLNPEMFSPHFGIDESGKGDFFGPLVIAGVHVQPEIARTFREAGVMDSKRISSDKKIRELASAIRKSRASQTVIVVSPQRYNALIEKMGNLNRLLAWGHARAIENLCGMEPECPRALSDKFADVRMIERALLPMGRKLELQQRTKAESDPAVAAASILAREAFIDWMDKASQRLGIKIPRGASAAVKVAARELIAREGRDVLPDLVKMHFKTAAEIL